MQLDRLVEFHKALADPIRIRILTLLSKTALHGQALSGKLGVTPPTISHHMTKLREAGLVSERRDGNTVYFLLNTDTLERKSSAVLSLVRGDSLGKGDESEMESKLLKERMAVIRNFFSPDGKLKTIPAQRKKKLIVFEHLLKGLKMGVSYTEKEINAHILQFHEDYATIRREFIMNQYMYRKDGIYELNPIEMWAKIE